MKNLFNSIQLTKPKNNVFDLSHDVKLSCRMGQLVPIMVQECVPGDKFNLSNESLLRFAPMVAPVMHRMDVSMHYFFVPNRITWRNWEKFITNTKDGGSLPAFPTITIDSDIYTKKLPDYLGVPYPNAEAITVNAIPFAAYQMIWNEFYRDQNLQAPLYDAGTAPLNDGDNGGDGYLTTLRLRAWMHDYFTSALPFAQKGDSVDIPLGDVKLKDDQTRLTYWRDRDDQSLQGGAVTGGTGISNGIVTVGGEFSQFDPNGTLEVEPTTINDLRRAFKLQEWLERNARGGTRYIENILAHFGVRSSDKRLQRPEYICGTKAPVVISEVLNTTGTENAPQGNMAGHGISVTNSNNGSYYCEEHGYIIGVMSVMPYTAYQQGIPKHYLKTTDPTQYYWPSFAHIGEQEILNAEIFVGETPNDVFGYTPRYAEYKYTPSRVAGDFKTTLDFWHLGRIFNDQPLLNAAFIECIPDTRIFAVEDDTDYLYCHIFNKVKAVRPMPIFGTPSF